MIRLRGITLRRGPTALLDDASATINPGERVALVGPNGSGKSSLLDALCGDVILDAGDIDLPTMRLVRLEQSTPGGARSASRHVFEADTALVAAEAELQRAEHEGGLALAEAHDRWDQLGGHTAMPRIGELLAGLGFSPAQVEAPVDTLSGGWRMRLNLARALFVPSDLLLLDEPTNHLDLDAIVWLERWLIRYPGIAIIVSHDRDFLDRVAQATLSIEDAKLVRYAGGYSSFERLRAERMLQAQQAASQQAAQVARLTTFINRFRAQATKARQVQSRIKALEKMALAAPVRAARGIDFEFPDAGDAPDPLLRLEDLDAGYGDTRILRGVRMTIPRGARIGILGRNGTGKSTLVRTLIGELAPLAGDLHRARSMRVGYFAQHGVEALRADDSPLQMLRRLWPDDTEATCRNLLGRFGFAGDDALRPIGPMSGGEKARLLLATIVRGAPHLLVLDEPTNHLDAATRDALAEALAEFEGALILVSHDRYLVRATVDRLVLVHDGRVDEFDGDLDDYLEWLQRGPGASAQAGANPSAASASAAPRAGANAAPVSKQDRAEERRQAAQLRQALANRLKPLDQRLATLEADVASAERELADIDARMADPDLYAQAGKAAELSRQRGLLASRRDELESEWLELSEQREALAAEIAAEKAAGLTSSPSQPGRPSGRR